MAPGYTARLRWNGYAGVSKEASGRAVTVLRALRTRWLVRDGAGREHRVRPDQLTDVAAPSLPAAVGDGGGSSSAAAGTVGADPPTAATAVVAAPRVDDPLALRGRLPAAVQVALDLAEQQGCGADVAWSPLALALIRVRVYGGPEFEPRLLLALWQAGFERFTHGRLGSDFAEGEFFDAPASAPTDTPA